MRKRKEIEEDYKGWEGGLGGALGVQGGRCILEVLLDIRDLLKELGEK